MAQKPTSPADDASRLMGGTKPPSDPDTTARESDLPGEQTKDLSPGATTVDLSSEATTVDLSSAATTGDPSSAATTSDLMPGQSASATPGGAPGEKTRQLSPGEKTVRLTPGEKTVPLTPGEKTVRLTPGEKTVRLTPGEAPGHLPGESTVRLEAAANPESGTPAATPATPIFDVAPVERVPVIPGPQSPTAGKPGEWPPHAPNQPGSPGPSSPTTSSPAASLPAPGSPAASSTAPTTPAAKPTAPSSPAPRKTSDPTPGSAQPAQPSPQTARPSGPPPPAWPPHPPTNHDPNPPRPTADQRTNPPAAQGTNPPHPPAAQGSNPPKAAGQARQTPADLANRARPAPANDANQVRQAAGKQPTVPATAMAAPPQPGDRRLTARGRAAVSPSVRPPDIHRPEDDTDRTPGDDSGVVPAVHPTATPPSSPAAQPPTSPAASPGRSSSPAATPGPPSGPTAARPAIPASAPKPHKTPKGRGQATGEQGTPQTPTRPGGQATAAAATDETMAIRLPAEVAADMAAALTVSPVADPAEADAAVARLPRAAIRPSLPSLLEPPAPRPVDALEPPKERRRRPRANGLGRAPWILALSSFGVVLVALGYAGGRYEIPAAIVAYWIGQVVVFTPVVIRLLSRRLAGVAESFVLVLGLALNQYMLKWFYSPDQFRFPDELQHWLATTIINESGELFQPNLALPPAVHFPGLAEMGAGVSQLTGLPVYPAGILVAGAAHLCFVGALFSLVLRSSGSPTIAGVSCVVYATTLHYLFFNSMYLYQTAALPFFMITIWAVRRWRAGGGRPFLAITIVGIGLTTVSHHVTAVALVATLALLGVTEFWADRSRPWRALLAPAIAAAMVAGWILLVARDVIDYLGAPIDQVMQTASMFFTDHEDAKSVATPVSLWQLAVQGLGLVFLLALFLALLRDTLARAERDPWRWSILAGTAVFFAGNAVRFLGSGGPEIAGRLSTFTYVPLSVVAAIALVHAPRLIPEKNAEGKRWLAVSPLPPAVPTDRFTPRVLVGATLVTVLMIGARVGGWPPAAQLLPGPYLAIGFERSVDAYGIEAAEWEYDMLGSGNRVGGDTVSVSLASTYGRQDPVREVGQLYYDSVWTLADDSLVDSLSINYLVADVRLTQHLPTNQAYFESDPHAGQITRPLTTTQLGKFDDLPTVSRLYDNGVIRIYRMGAP